MGKKLSAHVVEKSLVNNDENNSREVGDGCSYSLVDEQAGAKPPTTDPALAIKGPLTKRITSRLESVEEQLRLYRAKHRRATVKSLPFEVLVEVFKWLDVKSIVHMSTVSRLFFMHSCNPCIWKRLCRRYKVDVSSLFVDGENVELADGNNSGDSSTDVKRTYKNLFIADYINRKNDIMARRLFADYPLLKPSPKKLDVEAIISQVPCEECEKIRGKALHSSCQGSGGVFQIDPSLVPRSNYILHSFTNSCELSNLVTNYSNLENSGIRRIARQVEQRLGTLGRQQTRRTTSNNSRTSNTITNNSTSQRVGGNLCYPTTSKGNNSSNPTATGQTVTTVILENFETGVFGNIGLPTTTTAAHTSVANNSTTILAIQNLLNLNASNSQVTLSSSTLVGGDKSQGFCNLFNKMDPIVSHFHL